MPEKNKTHCRFVPTTIVTFQEKNGKYSIKDIRKGPPYSIHCGNNRLISISPIREKE